MVRNPAWHRQQVNKLLQPGISVPGQQPLHQRMQHFFLRRNGKKLLHDAVANADAFHPITAGQFVMHQFGRRKDAHAAGTKGLEQCAVVEFAHKVGPHGQAVKPLVERMAHVGMAGRQQDGNRGQRAGGILLRLLYSDGRRIPGQCGRIQ